MKWIMYILPALLFLVQPVFAEYEWENRIYLASSPRSGNHWTRYLIEEATHIATSSVYRDVNPRHQRKVYPWGGFCPPNGYKGESRYPVTGEAVVIKTHYPFASMQECDGQPYTATIRVIRHPIDSLYSVHVFRKNPEGSEIRPKKLAAYVNQWRRFHEYWDQQENVFTFRYEDMLADPEPYLRAMLDLIGYPYTDEDITRAIDRHPPFGAPLKHLCHYSPEERAYIAQELAPLLAKYGYSIPNH